MPTETFPISQWISGTITRLETFRVGGLVTASEKLFAQAGFIKRNDGLFECISCGVIKKVYQDIPWSKTGILRLHMIGCKFDCLDNEYINRWVDFINARIPRGTPTFPVNVILTVLAMGFKEELIKLAVNQYFSDYGAFPDIPDLLEYILRYG